MTEKSVFVTIMGAPCQGLPMARLWPILLPPKVNSPLEFYMIWLHAPGVSRQRRLPLSVPDILPYFWSA